MLSTSEAQAHLDMLQALVQQLREREERSILRKLRDTGSAAELWERDAHIAHLQENLSRLTDANDGLLFGHIDTLDQDAASPESAAGTAPHEGAIPPEGVGSADNSAANIVTRDPVTSGARGNQWYIGRMGLTDPATHDVRLVDWRAPVARPFYTATPLHPEGVRVRSHIETNSWRVSRVSAERITAGPGESSSDPSAPATSLLAAVDRERSGHMNDIVATIQGEQDAIIRSELRGTLLVQGGPGTGKTAVALHRAAYLLYEHRDRLERSGVLIVGPNPVFLDYISQVLPSLGETSVVLRTLGTLLPGVTVTRESSAEEGLLKGDLGLVPLISQALEARQVPGNGKLTVHLDSAETVVISAQDLSKLRRRARQRHGLHNEVRGFFEIHFSLLVARQLTQLSEESDGFRGMIDGDEQETAEELRSDEGFLRACDHLWPILTPEAVMRDAFRNASRARNAGRSASEQRGRPRKLAPGPTLSTEQSQALAAYADLPGISEADVPLLDEAADLLGEDPRPEAIRRARAQAKAQEELEYAQGVLDQLADTTTDDAETLAGVSAAALAARHRGGDGRTLSERAGGDRTWTYGHLIVDEAQELSPMALRALIRRCPMQSITLVGDINQSRTFTAGHRWEAVLGQQIRALRRAELTVNYRTPAEIMTLAEGVREQLDPEGTPARSLRASGHAPVFLTLPSHQHAARAATEALDFLRSQPAGTIGIIAPEPLLAAVAQAFPEHHEFSGAEQQRLWLVSPAGSKGLEFDRVIVVDPTGISGTELRGLTDLYVALTRATQRLTVIHEGPLPVGMQL